VLLTGALHLDGFLDACDGLFGGGTPNERLRIMRDERVGAYAVIGGVLLILLKFACLTSVANAAALLVAPTIGRAAMALAIAAFPYARSEGLGRTMKDRSGWKESLLTVAVAALVSAGIGHWVGIVAFVFGVATTLAGGRFVLRRVPGMTGDIYGALCEIVEVLVLLVFVAGEGLSA
jgi:adenosylcobinamide-GDP ribazoletransferase